MKMFNSLCCFALLFAGFSSEMSTNTLTTSEFATISIDAYLSTIHCASESNEVTLYSDFLIKEADGDFYRVDFMVECDGSVTVLETEIEKEYHIMDSFSTKLMQSHSFVIPTIIPNVEKA